MPEHNPVSIEQDIRSCANRIANGVSECSNRYSIFLALDHQHEQAFARAYLEHAGPAHEKKYAAILACRDERDARDAADASYRYADRSARALESELRALQSVGASVRSMYGVAGRGEGA